MVLSGATASYVRPWGSIPVLAKPVDTHVLKREVRIALRVDSGPVPVVLDSDAHRRFDATLEALDAHSAKLRGDR